MIGGNKMNNRKYVKMMIVGVGAMLLSACAGVGLDTESGEAKKSRAQHFYQHWVNSYEEQTGGDIIFRPEGSMQFPPSRFRMAYIFNLDGSCQYKYLSPNDAHRMENCVFTKVGNKVYIYDDGGHLMPELSFTLIASPSKDLMRLTQGIQAPQPKPAKSTVNKAEQK